MAERVEELLDMLYQMVDEAKNVPLSSDKCILDRSEALNLLSEIKGQFPAEITEARKIVEQRNDYVASAKREAELIRKQADEYARQTLAKDALIARSKQRGAEIIREANERSRELRRAANAYCEDALRRTEEAVAEAHEEVKKSRARFHEAAMKSGAAPEAGASHK